MHRGNNFTFLPVMKGMAVHAAHARKLTNTLSKKYFGKFLFTQIQSHFTKFNKKKINNKL